ncbi:MAG TPA: Hpt domain-containing protein [Acidobacteriaceae bacterium]|nr:Hpt domain-containing protein [Acidobacteriaceae bacterium]
MDSSQQVSPSLAAALDRLWERHLPEIEERLAAIESAAAATAAGTLSPGQRQAAHSAAHNLAGVLGTFGLAEGTGPAREIEHLYAAETAPAREDGPRLASIAATLRSLVQSRKPPQTPAK